MSRVILAVLAVSLAAPAFADTVVAVPGGGRTSEVLVLTSGAVTLTSLAYRRAFEIQNLGPNAIYCTIDGQAPLKTGALGRKIDSGSTWAMNAADSIVVKCIAATADQSTTAATQFTEIR
jgi:hypothetical protein